MIGSVVMSVVWITALFVAVALTIQGLLPQVPASDTADESDEDWLDRQL